MKAEPLLAKLNELRKDLEADPDDMEWLALHHAFCFISYKIGDFQKYLDETELNAERGGSTGSPTGP
jgi:hypothetical protein